ncbi:MAG: lanthionine synthetase LanC family protein [Bacteroidota bacterium]
MNEKQIFLEAAVKIADRILNKTIWNTEKCTWEIFAPDLSMPKLRKGKWENAGGMVYSGTAGIALFLAEIFRITGDKKYLKVLSGALNNSFDEVKKLPLNSFGFHSGRVGIAYAFVISGKYLERDDYKSKGLQILEPLLGKEFEDYGLDVIGGAGGAIQPLLKIYEVTDNDAALNISLNLAEPLIQKAKKEPHGWSWGSGNTNYRNLCGYAHGASGIGHAFLELYNLTNSNYYLYAAEQAFLYERQFYSEENKNWSDFRYNELSEYVHYNRLEELKEAIQKNELLPYQIRYMSAWCHGSPGIGLSRLRAYELTGNETYLKESLNACEGTIQSLKTTEGNYSLCHGFLGNAETLLTGSKILGDKGFLEIALQKALEGIDRFENKNLPWACGTMGSVSDPSLMLGEAGIGLFLLRLFDTQTLSALSLHAKARKIETEQKDALSFRKNYVDIYFKNIIAAIDTIENKKGLILEQNKNFIGGKSDVEKIFVKIENYIADCEDELKEKLSDYFLIEKEKYLKTLQIKDFSEEFLKKLNMPSEFQIDNCNLEFALDEYCELLVQKYNWSSESSAENILANPEEDEQYFLLMRSNNKIESFRINPFFYTILFCIKKNSSFDEIVSEVSSLFEIEFAQTDLLRQKIKEQLINAYKGGLIKITIREKACSSNG